MKTSPEIIGHSRIDNMSIYKSISSFLPNNCIRVISIPENSYFYFKLDVMDKRNENIKNEIAQVANKEYSTQYEKAEAISKAITEMAEKYNVVIMTAQQPPCDPTDPHLLEVQKCQRLGRALRNNPDVIIVDYISLLKL